jgi:hypothetical protein
MRTAFVLVFQAGATAAHRSPVEQLPTASGTSQNFFARLKTFRRAATRYDKFAETCFGWVLLATIIKCGAF